MLRSLTTAQGPISYNLSRQTGTYPPHLARHGRSATYFRPQRVPRRLIDLDAAKLRLRVPLFGNLQKIPKVPSSLSSRSQLDIPSMCCPPRRRGRVESSFDLDRVTAVRANFARPAAPEADYVRDTQLRSAVFIRRMRAAGSHQAQPRHRSLHAGHHARIYAVLRALVLRSARLTRDLAAKGRLRSAVRALHLLDDRMLADIGVTRGEIESAVRDGLPVRMMRKSRHRDWNGIPARGRAA